MALTFEGHNSPGNLSKLIRSKMEDVVFVSDTSSSPDTVAIDTGREAGGEDGQAGGGIAGNASRRGRHYGLRLNRRHGGLFRYGLSEKTRGYLAFMDLMIVERSCQWVSPPVHGNDVREGVLQENVCTQWDRREMHRVRVIERRR